MRKYLKSLGILAIIFICFVFLVAFYFFRPLPLPPIPDDVLFSANEKWDRYMLSGKGAYCNSEYCGSSVGDAGDTYFQSIRQANSGKSGIIINSESFDGNYIKLQGGHN